MGILEVNQTNYEAEVKNFAGTVVLDFWATWCGPCQMLTPIMEELAKETGADVKVCKIDVDESPELADSFGVMSIPFVVVIKEGKVVHSSVGLKSKQALLELIS